MMGTRLSNAHTKFGVTLKIALEVPRKHEQTSSTSSLPGRPRLLELGQVSQEDLGPSLIVSTPLHTVSSAGSRHNTVFDLRRAAPLVVCPTLISAARPYHHLARHIHPHRARTTAGRPRIPRTYAKLFLEVGGEGRAVRYVQHRGGAKSLPRSSFDRQIRLMSPARGSGS